MNVTGVQPKRMVRTDPSHRAAFIAPVCDDPNCHCGLFGAPSVRLFGALLGSTRSSCGTTQVLPPPTLIWRQSRITSPSNDADMHDSLSWSSPDLSMNARLIRRSPTRRVFD